MKVEVIRMDEHEMEAALESWINGQFKQYYGQVKHDVQGFADWVRNENLSGRISDHDAYSLMRVLLRQIDEQERS